MKAWIGLLALVLFLGCTISSEDEEIVYTTYTTPEFSIDYPRTWDIGEEGLGYVLFISEQENMDDTLLEAFDVTVAEWGGNESFAYFEELEKAAMYEGDRIIDNDYTEFKGHPALRLEIEGPFPETGEQVGYVTIYFKQGSRIYRLWYSFEKGKEEKFAPIIERMLDSFEPGEVGEVMASPTNTSELEFVVYTGQEFLVEYPYEWSIEEYKAGFLFLSERSVEFMSPREDLSDILLDGFIVEVWESEETLDDFEDLEIAMMSGDERITRNERIKFKGHDALYMETEGSQETNIEVYYKTIYFKQGNKAYRLHQAYEKSKQAKYAPIMEYMLESFEVR